MFFIQYYANGTIVDISALTGFIDCRGVLLSNFGRSSGLVGTFSPNYAMIGVGIGLGWVRSLRVLS